MTQETEHIHPTSATMSRAASPEVLDELRSRFGALFSVSHVVREQHGRDESSFSIPPPDAVVFADSQQDVVDLLRIASRHGTPVIPFGVGSSLEGHVLAVEGGICLDMARMKRICSVNAEDLCVTVQAGVTREELNQELRHLGLFFPIDPGAHASLGGMAATCASGTNAVRYGTMRENVLALKVVMASGEVLNTGTLARKSSAGYDLTRLFVGSEGTLGVITEVSLKVYPLPEAVSAATCCFPDVRAAVQTTMALIQVGAPIARVELVDGRTVKMVNAHSGTSLREQPTLLMEFHGSPTSVEEQAALAQEVATDNGGQAFEWAVTPEERTRLWTARHHAYFAAVQSRPGCRAITTDVCVPISRLAEIIDDSVVQADLSGIPYFLVGHVGDGNFHMGYLIDPLSADERKRAEELNSSMVSRALALGGTCTGEHGIGLHKIGFLLEEAGHASVEVMKAIKRALDPGNILNPGKVFSLT